MLAQAPSACRFRPIVELRSGRVRAIAVVGGGEDGIPTAALAALAAWRRTRPAAREAALVVDLAASALARVTVGDLAGALSTHGLPPDALIVRVARFGLHDPTVALERLVDAGVSVVVAELDLRGAGTGLLAGAPIDAVELPRAAVATVDTAPPSAPLRQLLSLAHKNDWLTIAPDVARDAQIKALDRLGCDLGAGPLVGGELDEAGLDRWLAAR